MFFQISQRSCSCCCCAAPETAHNVRFHRRLSLRTMGLSIRLFAGCCLSYLGSTPLVGTIIIIITTMGSGPTTDECLSKFCFLKILISEPAHDGWTCSTLLFQPVVCVWHFCLPQSLHKARQEGRLSIECALGEYTATPQGSGLIHFQFFVAVDCSTVDEDAIRIALHSSA